MKKKFLSFIFAFAFILTGTACLTACGGDGYTFYDMFGKEYTMDSSANYRLQVTQNEGTSTHVKNWKQWVKDNFATIEHNGVETAEEYIAQVEDYLTLNLANNKIKIEQTSETDGLREGKVTLTLQQNTLVFDVKSHANSDYAGSYQEGTLYLEGKSDKVGDIQIISKDYGKTAGIVLLTIYNFDPMYKTFDIYSINSSEYQQVILIKTLNIKNVKNI